MIVEIYQEISLYFDIRIIGGVWKNDMRIGSGSFTSW